jgi:hypothetical protein
MGEGVYQSLEHAKLLFRHLVDVGVAAQVFKSDVTRD